MWKERLRPRALLVGLGRSRCARCRIARRTVPGLAAATVRATTALCGLPGLARGRSWVDLHVRVNAGHATGENGARAHPPRGPLAAPRGPCTPSGARCRHANTTDTAPAGRRPAGPRDLPLTRAAVQPPGRHRNGRGCAYQGPMARSNGAPRRAGRRSGPPRRLAALAGCHRVGSRVGDQWPVLGRWASGCYAHPVTPRLPAGPPRIPGFSGRYALHIGSPQPLVDKTAPGKPRAVCRFRNGRARAV